MSKTDETFTKVELEKILDPYVDFYEMHDFYEVEKEWENPRDDEAHWKMKICEYETDDCISEMTVSVNDDHSMSFKATRDDLINLLEKKIGNAGYATDFALYDKEGRFSLAQGTSNDVLHGLERNLEETTFLLFVDITPGKLKPALEHQKEYLTQRAEAYLR